MTLLRLTSLGIFFLVTIPLAQLKILFNVLLCNYCSVKLCKSVRIRKAIVYV